MKAIYAAIDGYKLDTNETLATLIDSDSVQGGNLISNPMDVATWTAGNSATLTKPVGFLNAPLLLTNGAASAGYAGVAITTVAGTYYLIRAYVEPQDSTTCQLVAGTSLGGTTLGTTTASNSDKIHDLVFKASGTTTYVHFKNASTTSGDSSYWSKIEVITLEHVGVDETTELQTNGTFTTDTSGWTSFRGAGLAIVSEQLEVTVSGASDGAAYQDIAVTPGVVYVISCDFKKGTGLGSYLNIWDGARVTQITSDYTTSSTTVQSDACTIKPTSATLRIELYVSGADTTTGYFGNVVCTKSGNLVSNCTFGLDHEWTLGTGWTISGGVATHSGATEGTLIQAIDANDLVVGQSYVLGIVTSGSASSPVLSLSTSNGAFRNGEVSITTDDTFYITVLCTHQHADNELYFTCTNDISIDNITLRRAVTDLSANGDGLEVHGEIVKVPVHYNSTTVAYANFSAYNYLKQPYSSNLDPGTGVWSVSGWFKSRANDGVDRAIFSRGYYNGSSLSGAFYDAGINDDGRFIAEITDDGFVTSDVIYSTGYYDDDNWHQFAFIRTATNYLQIYIDGNSAGTNVAISAAASLTNANADLRIGQFQNASFIYDDFIAGIKIDIGNAWTAQKILTDYNSEKVLYRPNEVYSVVGNNLTLSCGSVEGAHQELVDTKFNEAVDGSREFFTRNTKRGFSLSTIPVNDRKLLEKFLRSTAAQSFTISEKSFEYGDDNTMTVYKVSQNESISRVGFGLYQVGFSVRER